MSSYNPTPPEDEERKIRLAAERYPVGTPILYYPIKGEPHFERSRIRSEPWALGSGHVVVKIEGRTGGVSVEHIAHEI